MKFCVDCKYFFPIEGKDACCKKHKDRDIVYGTPTAKCEYMRNEMYSCNNNHCGVKGKFWAARS